MKHSTVKLLSGNACSIFIYAARYAHDRNTGAAMQVVNEILRNWNRFPLRVQEQLKREAVDAVYNKHDWRALIDM